MNCFNTKPTIRPESRTLDYKYAVAAYMLLSHAKRHELQAKLAVDSCEDKVIFEKCVAYILANG
ncbi:hypothetical protein [Psychromonas aquimarina]|uniref:hypothetical protein n=1 Tax=Psychromonas aquimarina TaxID=444919 RepID=UPI000406B3EA|nr:hypothetical protein [Psychromonas aquimarina]